MKAFETKPKPWVPAGLPATTWIVEKIDEEVEIENAGEGRRTYLGTSGIGDHCIRKVWYGFRWCKEEAFEGRMLRLFNRGHREEESLIAHLRSTGMEVQDRDPETRAQFRTSDIGGHFGGGIDGRGRYRATDPWFLLEFKTYSKKRFDNLESLGLRKESEKYFAQMQVYMNANDFPYGLFVAVCKDDDRIYMEWVKFEPKQAAKYLERAEFVISSQEPPDRITNDPTDFRCRFCHMHSICHGAEVSEKNCRSCKHAEPVEDGQWRCNAGHDFGTTCNEWSDIAK